MERIRTRTTKLIFLQQQHMSEHIKAAFLRRVLTIRTQTATGTEDERGHQEYEEAVEFPSEENVQQALNGFNISDAHLL